jgi:hypothetical protein
VVCSPSKLLDNQHEVKRKMARLAEVKDATSGHEQGRTVYVNPLNVIAIEPIQGGTRIVLNGGQVYQTSQNLNVVLASVQSAMV